MVSVEVFKDPRSDAEKALDRLRRDGGLIDRKLRVMFANQIVGVVQQYWLAGQALHRRSGDLAASISYRDFSQHETMVGSYGPVYARIHELGGTIVPRVKKWLRFKVGNRWVMTKKVRMPARPYLFPGIQYYFDARASGEAERFLQKELKKRESA